MSAGKGSNTLEQQLEHVANAGKRHPWPAEISPDLFASSIFEKAQMQRAHEDWSPLDIVELARVSKLIAKAERETAIAESEGTLVPGGKNGTVMVCNPRLRVVSELNSAINSGLRRLGINGASVPPSDTNVRARATAQREVEQTVGKTSEERRSMI